LRNGAHGEGRTLPVRSCVQCGVSGDKGSLLRIAGRPERGWEPDPEGKRPGRGIYLCRKAECIEGFMRRVRTPKGGARWRMGPGGAVLADRLAAWWAVEAEKQGE